MSTHHKRSSYLTSSVVSANAVKSKQSKHALPLHQALLFCCSQTKVTLAVPFLGSCPLHADSAPLPCSFQSVIFSHPFIEGLPRTQAPSSNQEPFSAPLLTVLSTMQHLFHSRMAHFQSCHLPKLWHLVHPHS